MNENVGVVHHPLPGNIRVLPRDKLVEHLQVQEFGQLLAHQYCVRRFFLHFPSAFYALRNIRMRVEAVLGETQLNNEYRLFVGRKSTAIARCMRALDSRQFRALAVAGKRREFRELLEREIEPFEDQIHSPILPFLSDDDLERLCEILADGCKEVNKIHDELNFLDFYDPFAMSSFVSGKLLLTHYLSAKHGIHSVRPWAEWLQPENRWRHTREAELDDAMASIAHELAFVIRRPASNVHVYGGDQRIAVDGVELKNHLILAVPIDKTPTNIDSALRHFRDALRQAFVDTHGCYANVSSPEFDNSLFMQNFNERTFLVNQTRQYRSRLSGLWMWDLVNPVAHGCGLAVSDALESIAKEAEAQLKQLALTHKEPLYDDSSYKNQYDLAVRQITPKLMKTTDPRQPRELDQYLTSGMAVLGRRSPAEAPDI
ncbi:hypothetical protein [Pseudomonas denitrificans (nom. rej.)]|uniref:Uncharacterized protein n=1 Tax=Pseudomonas denitrificans TaxID=43306 RepID=A0A9X7R708_PSEDE|nr:hypothetical protein [Pseudomonas denitrificans (nom. rej.)]QEY75039.1 hypothetical protein F1C79_27345 [Pseudomonas denitrificans (nom. rej.)]